MMRFLAFAGILITFFLSIWYTLKTYNEGDTQFIYLFMSFGIAILLFNSVVRPGKRKD